MNIDEKVEYAIAHTEVVRAPRQKLATFGVTCLTYYLVTEPLFTEVDKSRQETVIRDGRVIAERPKIVTPSYLTRLEGFTENARKYVEKLAQQFPDAPGLLYSYRNEPANLSIVSGSPEAVIYRLNEDIEKGENSLAAIIRGVDEMWDVSLLKFISELTGQSLARNIGDFSSRGLLQVDGSGVPAQARYGIDELFRQAKADRSKAHELKLELDRWGLFSEYENRFYDLFR